MDSENFDVCHRSLFGDIGSQVVDMTTSEPEVIRVGKGDPSMFEL